MPIRGALFDDGPLDENGDPVADDNGAAADPAPVFDELPGAGEQSGGTRDGGSRETETSLSPPSEISANPASTNDIENNERATRTLSQEPVGLATADGEFSPRDNVRALPEQGGDATEDLDPYAPVGLRLGTLRLFPVLEQTIGYTSNADFEADGQSAGFSLTDARVTFQSDWSRHELRGAVGGTYQRFFDDASDDLPAFDANAELRLDAADGIAVTLGGSYDFSTESATDDNLTLAPGVSLLERPGVHRASAFGEVARSGRKLFSSLRGAVEREHFEAAPMSDGGTLQQDDRNNTLFSITGRVGYETSPAVQPFVEANIGKRVYEEAIDRNGNERSGMEYGLRGGVALDFGEKLTGELAVGYASRTFDDPFLETLDGVTFDGEINWSPERFTTVTATASTQLIGSTNFDENGSIAYIGSVGVTRDIRPSLSVNARVEGIYQEFADAGREDITLRTEAGATWRLNRTLSLIGTIGYETVDSTDEDASYDAFTARAGIRIQR